MAHLTITKNSGCNWDIENTHVSDDLEITVKLMDANGVFQSNSTLTILQGATESAWTPSADGIYSFEYTNSATDYIYYLFVDCTLVTYINALADKIICEDVDVCCIDNFSAMIFVVQAMYNNLTTAIQGQSYWSTVPANITTLITDVNTLYNRANSYYTQYIDGNDSGCNC